MDEIVPEETAITDFTQLTQARVPLENAAEAFSRPDATGRVPIVVIPQRLYRIHNELVIGGVLVLAAGLVVSLLVNDSRLLNIAIPLALILLILGLYRSFIVRIPEGTNGLLTLGGRYYKTLRSGISIVLPWIGVSHLVTYREIPFDVPVVEAPAKDNVRARVDSLLTFTITDPQKFVYRISTDDFDHVLQAACRDALRSRIRRIPTSSKVMDLVRTDLSDVQQALNQDMESYGVTITKFTIVFAQPPAEFMRSLEARRLAAIQHAEQMERQSLALRRQTDEEILLRQEVVARVEREREQLEILLQQARLREQVVELEAKAEALRLERLDERLKAFPVAAQFDWKRSQLEVARSLAGNTRAVVQLGEANDIGRAFVWGDMWSDLTHFQFPSAAAAVPDSANTIEPPGTNEQAAEA